MLEWCVAIGLGLWFVLAGLFAYIGVKKSFSGIDGKEAKDEVR